jgi:excisionase family DNA binding protein
MKPRSNSNSVARRAYQVNEAVATYRLSRSTIYKLMAAGTLRSVKVGGRRLIPVEALEALIGGGAQ